MPTITIKKLNLKLEVTHGCNLFQALKEHQVPIASSCNGEAVCGKCIIYLKQGSLLPPNKDEERLLKIKKHLSGIRISCQIQVRSDIEIDTDYW